MIYHVYTAYEPGDLETARRNQVAQLTWRNQPWQEVPVHDADLPRMWNEKGRHFPFIRDVLDLGVKKAGDEDIVVYTNADIMVRRDCCPVIIEALQNVDACYCYRRDWHHKVLKPVPDDDFEKAIHYPGSDLKAFRAGWWRFHREAMPDMVLGAEAWDPVIRTLINETNPNAKTEIHNVICHERHGSYWENPEHRYKLKMQLHCLALAKKFFIERGMNPRQFGIGL